MFGSNAPKDLSNNKVVNFNKSYVQVEKPEPIEYTNLSETKVVNMNDFIFRQNLEFYPNLQGLTVEDNNLIYKTNGEILLKEPLTFDLRTLPGDVWLVSPKEFIEIIKMNKTCRSLVAFRDLLNGKAFDQVVISNAELENSITNYMNLYFSMKESFHSLVDDNKILLNNIETLIATLPKETLIGTIVNNKLDAYLEMTKTMGDEKGKTMALTLKNKNLPSLIEEEEPMTLPKAGYINIAILLYGIINIGIILAIAFMK